jgi:hypothetical protein
MVMPKKIILLYFIAITSLANADEGMWLPQLLKQLNETDMQNKGLRLTADDIYSINNTSLKDGVLLFGGGCTGEVISSNGLLLTNHHCGYSSIQSHSTVGHDYLTTGYWAQNRSEELACPGLTVTFIIRIENVTEQVTSQLEPGMSEAERDARIRSVTMLLEKKATEGTHYSALTKPFFYGNEFYMFVTETFRDIRLVGAPPSSIGKFGAETDNWVWPRQTGDFSLFRIYAGPDNKPADYSKDNKPFSPRFYFKISLAGVKEGDFTMVYGFPGRTTEYITSCAVALTYEQINPARIKIREARLRLMNEGMHITDSIRISYAAKYSTISNYYKKWQGEQLGLKKNNAVEKKREQEQQFSDWVLKDAGRKNKYIDLLPSLEKTYAEMKPYAVTSEYINEALLGIELVAFAANYKTIVNICSADSVDRQSLKTATGKIIASDGFYKNYHKPTDMNICKALLKIYFEDADSGMYPAVYSIIQKKYKGSVDRYVDDLYKKSWLTDKRSVKANLENFKASDLKKITGDPAYVLYKSIAELQGKIASPLSAYNEQVIRLQRTYITALREMQADRKFYPDANLTLRVAYGNVKGFEPRDGIIYKYYTTLEGVMQKADPNNEEFVVPARLKELYDKKDYGRYGVNGVMPVAFLASNHTSGGNSGSPVINGRGELIGTNFDRVWEGTMSDIMYDPEICRNITLDIRYTLFIIDKFAGAGYLVDEMTLVN